MLFNTALIALSYLLWFITDNIILYLVSEGRMSEERGEFWETISRTFRLVCQVLAFCWILISFSNYGIKVDEKIHQYRVRESLKKLKPGPIVVV